MLILLAGVLVLVVTPHLLARPHVLAWPVMVAWVGGLVGAVDRRQTPSYLLLPVMVVWANLHGTFVLGLALVGACGLDAVVLADRPARLRVALAWLGFGILALVAACLTPYGPESLLATYRVLSLGSALSLIGEWQPPDLGHIGSFEVCLLLALGFALWRGFILRPVRIVILLGLIHLALSAARNGEILGLLAPLLLAAPIAGQFGETTAPRAERGRLPAFVPLAAAVVLLPLTVLLARIETFEPRADLSPVAAVAALKASGAARVLNSYNFGGYLIAAGVPTFIDGRTELYGSDFTVRYTRAVNLADLGDFLALLDQYKIGRHAAGAGHACGSLPRPRSRLETALRRRRGRGPNAAGAPPDPPLTARAAPFLMRPCRPSPRSTRYPVKGLSAEPLADVTLRPGETMPFDRAYAIENGASGFDPAAPRTLPKILFLMLMRTSGWPGS